MQEKEFDKMSEMLEKHRILEKAFVKLLNECDDTIEDNAHKTKTIEYLETLNEEKSEEIEILESLILNLENGKEVTHLSSVPETNITPEYDSSLQNSICLLKLFHSDSSVPGPYFVLCQEGNKRVESQVHCRQQP